MSIVATWWFKSRITLKLGSGQTSDIAEIKFEAAEIKNMVAELFSRSVIQEPIIEIVMSIVYVENIWAILAPIEETRQKTQEK